MLASSEGHTSPGGARPSIPDVPYVIGQAGGLFHAASHRAVTWAVEHSKCVHRLRAGSECEISVVIPHEMGEFRRGNEWIDRFADRLCSRCAWAVALDQNTETTELDAVAPSTGAEAEALRRLMPDPLLTRRILERILDGRRQERECDADDPQWPQILGQVTVHRPVPLFEGDCSEGGCDHDNLNDCYGAATTVACHACSVQAGSWAGEWEGRYLITVPAPCAVLPVMADHYALARRP